MRSYAVRSQSNSHAFFPYKLLEELCAKNNLGSPIYTLLQTKAAPDDKGEPLYLYKVSDDLYSYVSIFSPSNSIMINV